MKIRLAVLEDSGALRNLYAQYIDTPVTFEYVLPTQIEFAGRMQSSMEQYPYLVCEEAGRIVGYAYAHRYMERAAYQWNAELSIYLDKNFTSRGLGKKLYAALIELLKLQGIKTVYAGVTLPNVKSEGLHRALGFQQLGIYHHTGYKCGKWHDVAWFAKSISSCERQPEPVTPFSSVPKKQITALLQKESQTNDKA